MRADLTREGRGNLAMVEVKLRIANCRLGVIESDHIDEMFLSDPDPIRVWTTALRTTIHSAEKMCPCSVLGTTAYDLPEEVAVAVKGFFTCAAIRWSNKSLTTEGAEWLLATTIGAQVISVAMGDFSAFDHVVTELMRARGYVIATPQPVAA